jgi:hypothetical protein
MCALQMPSLHSALHLHIPLLVNLDNDSCNVPLFLPVNLYHTTLLLLVDLNHSTLVLLVYLYHRLGGQAALQLLLRQLPPQQTPLL